MEANNKRKIKGIQKTTKRLLSRAGIISAMALMIGISNPEMTLQTAKAQEMAIDDNENQKKTDLEKYFDSDIPMNETYKITAESDIYKGLEFYEAGTAPSEGSYIVERDPLGLLVIGNGMTLKYQESVLKHLSEYGDTNEEILDNINKLIDSGITVSIPEKVIQEETIKEIQRCRDNSINAAKRYGINLSEAQINTLTEMNYRYGKGQANLLFKHLSEGGNLREFSIPVTRTMPEEKWNEQYSMIKKQAEISSCSIKNGEVSFTVNIKPFNGIGIEATIENLESADLEKLISNTQNDYFTGDKRRCFARQIGIEYDECFSDSFFICKDSTGACQLIRTGKNIDIVKYLKEKQNELNPDKYSNNIENNVIIEEQIKDDNTMVEEQIVKDDNTMTEEQIIDEEKYSESFDKSEISNYLIKIENKEKGRLLKVFKNIGLVISGMAMAGLSALGLYNNKQKEMEAEKKRKKEERRARIDAIGKKKYEELSGIIARREIQRISSERYNQYWEGRQKRQALRESYGGYKIDHDGKRAQARIQNTNDGAR